MRNNDHDIIAITVPIIVVGYHFDAILTIIASVDTYLKEQCATKQATTTNSSTVFGLSIEEFFNFFVKQTLELLWRNTESQHDKTEITVRNKHIINIIIITK